MVAEIPLVSVIIPAHNRSAWLRECLQSVAWQTYPRIQVLVVDDASDEDLAAVVQGITWPAGYDVEYIRSEQNVGPGAARELGRQQARGDYLCYLDSDDLWHPEKVATQVAALQQHPEAGMCYCRWCFLHDLGHDTKSPPASHLIRGYEVETILPHVLIHRPWVTHACMWTKASSQFIGAWSDFWTGEDVWYDVKAGAAAIRPLMIDRCLAYVRRAPVGGSLTKLDASFRWTQASQAMHQIYLHLRDEGLLRDPLLQLIMLSRLAKYIHKMLELGLIYDSYQVINNIIMDNQITMTNKLSLYLLKGCVDYLGVRVGASLGWRVERRFMRKALAMLKRSSNMLNLPAIIN